MVVSLWPHFLAQPCTSAVKWRVSAMYDGAVPIHYLVKHYSQQNKPLGKLYCWVCQWFFKSANIWQRYKHSRKNMIVSCTFFVFQQCIDQARKVHETTTLLLVTLPSIHRFKKNLFLLADSEIHTVKWRCRVRGQGTVAISWAGL